MSKNSIIAIIIISVLVVVFGVSLTFFLLNNQDYKDLYEDEKIRIVAFGKNYGAFTLEDLLELSQAREFDAIYKPNNLLPISKTYTGIYLQDHIIALGIDISEVNQVQFIASNLASKLRTSH